MMENNKNFHRQQTEENNRIPEEKKEIEHI